MFVCSQRYLGIFHLTQCMLVGLICITYCFWIKSRFDSAHPLIVVVSLWSGDLEHYEGLKLVNGEHTTCFFKLLFNLKMLLFLPQTFASCFWERMLVCYFTRGFKCDRSNHYTGYTLEAFTSNSSLFWTCVRRCGSNEKQWTNINIV